MFFTIVPECGSIIMVFYFQVTGGFYRIKPYVIVITYLEMGRNKYAGAAHKMATYARGWRRTYVQIRGVSFFKKLVQMVGENATNICACNKES